MFNDLFKAYADKQIKTMTQSEEDGITTCHEARIKISSYIQALDDMKKCNKETNEMYADYMHQIDRWIDFKINLVLMT